MTLLTLHTGLDEIAHTIWRRVEAPDDLTLGALHLVIQVLFGWEKYHLWEFEREGKRYGLPEEEWEETLDTSGVTPRDVLGTRKETLNYV